jgi:hypothetical protein
MCVRATTILQGRVCADSFVFLVANYVLSLSSQFMQVGIIDTSLKALQTNTFVFPPGDFKYTVPPQQVPSGGVTYHGSLVRAFIHSFIHSFMCVCVCVCCFVYFSI